MEETALPKVRSIMEGSRKKANNTKSLVEEKKIETKACTSIR